MARFTAISHMPAPRERLYRWHAAPGAFERLAPPGQTLRVVEHSGGIEDGSRLIFRLGGHPFAPVWEAHHEDHIEGRQFVDRALRSPFRAWRHLHRFEDHDEGSRLVDTVDFTLPLAPLSNLIGLPIAKHVLERMFAQRHLRTRHDLMRHEQFAELPRRRVAITGASGLIGKALSSFLTTGGHTVLRMVRGEAQSANEVSWSPQDGTVDIASLEGVDAVIHLAGESIAGGRWTDDKKKRILESRTKGTHTLAKALASMEAPPRVFISASATGWYGARGSDVLTEDNAPGEGFLSHVCQEWEAAAEPARKAGIRVIHPRIGVVLSPDGGALGEMLTPFRLGVGGRIGTGRQYMSWIALDDVVAALHWLMMKPKLSGPFNLTSPRPVDNAEFTKSLGRVIRRPTIFPLPAFAVRTLFGEMGERLLLEGARVIPARLQKSGFTFLHEELENALRAELGIASGDADMQFEREASA